MKALTHIAKIELKKKVSPLCIQAIDKCLCKIAIELRLMQQLGSIRYL